MHVVLMLIGVWHLVIENGGGFVGCKVVSCFLVRECFMRCFGPGVGARFGFVLCVWFYGLWQFLPSVCFSIHPCV